MMEHFLQNDILRTLLEKGIEVTLTLKGFQINGFYKSGQILLVPKEDGTFTAHSRYGQTDHIEEFDDLIFLNLQWWRSSKERCDVWSVPEQPWREEMLRLGLIQVETKTTTLYK